MTRDTTIMEYTAEDLIAHKLQRAGILIAKPKFDHDGADLLALLHVKDNAKFCRIQCKGRSLTKSPTSEVRVPKHHVSDGFILFLFVETGERDKTHLFCFLGSEIRSSWTVRRDVFVLNVSSSKFESDLTPFIFDGQKVHDIKKAIINVNVKGEFNTMVTGYIEATMPTMRGGLPENHGSDN